MCVLHDFDESRTFGRKAYWQSLSRSLFPFRNENRITERAFNFAKTNTLNLRRLDLGLALGADDVERGENFLQVDLLPGRHAEIF
jgi:hypothetical protein